MTSSDDPDEYLTAQVLNNHLILDTIVNYVICDKEGRSTLSDIHTCRLVHPSWYHSVGRVLRKRRKPLYHLRFPARIPERTFADPLKSLQHFTSLVTTPIYSDVKIAPIIATILEDCCWEEGVQTVANSVSRLGKSLIGLTLELPRQHGPLELETSNLTFDFSILNNFTLTLGRPAENGEEAGGEDGAALERNCNVTPFIQKILSGCKELKTLSVPGGVSADEPVPVYLENLYLPNSLTTLIISRGLTTKNVTGLLKSPLLQLTTLMLPFGDAPTEDDSVFKILQKVSGTLKTLILQGPITSVISQQPPSKIRLPVMKCLEVLNVSANNLEWSLTDPTMINPPNPLPALTTVKFKNQSLDQFCKLAPRLSLESVKNVSLQLYPQSDEETSSSGLLTSATLILNTFPQLITLNLDFDVGFGVRDLDYVLRNFRNLQELRLTFRGGSEENVGSAALILLLLGAPIKCVRGERGGKGTWENETFAGFDQMSPLLNLKALRSLHLLYADTNIDVPFELDPLLNFAARNMPNLWLVCVSGFTEVSQATATKWREAGRVLETFSGHLELLTYNLYP